MPEAASENVSTSIIPTFTNSTLPRASKKRNKPSVVILPVAQEIVVQSPVTENPLATAAPQSQKSFIRMCNRAKRVRFFRNGDQYFKGIWYAVAFDRFRSFEALLEELNRTIGDLVNLPHGVRCVFSIDGQRRISGLEQLDDGESYVCSSNDAFKKIDYENAREPLWSYSTPRRPKFEIGRRGFTTLAEPSSAYANDFVKPKIVTVVRNGVKPRKVVRLLLNKRTARSFERVLSDVTALVKLDTGAVRKLFTLEGKLVSCLADLFNDDDVFIACGNEKLSLEDLLLDSEEYKALYSSKYKPVVKNSNVTSRPPPFASRCGLFLNSKLKGRFGNEYSGASPEVRRKFLNVKNGWRAKYTQPLDNAIDKSAGSANLCLNSNNSSLSPVYSLEIEDRFKIGRIIGDGNFAVVHECICRSTGDYVALKVIDKAKCNGKYEMIDSEVSIMKRLRHPYIVQLFDFFDLDEQYFLVMECVKGGDLFDSLISKRYYNEAEAAVLMQNLLSALEYLHERQIVHRDVKPENLLVYENEFCKKRMKLADFGLATHCDVDLYTICGTPTYVAPEILTENGYGSKIDIWASGIIMYIMLCGFPPFVSLANSQEELFELILSGEYTFPKPYWDHVSATAKTLIHAMLQRNVSDRFNACEALSHVWITGEGKVDPDLEEIFEKTLSEQRPDSDPNNLDDSDSDFICNKTKMKDSGATDLNKNYSDFYYSRRRSMDELSNVTSEFPETWHYQAGDTGRKMNGDQRTPRSPKRALNGLANGFR